MTQSSNPFRQMFETKSSNNDFLQKMLASNNSKAIELLMSKHKKPNDESECTNRTSLEKTPSKSILKKIQTPLEVKQSLHTGVNIAKSGQSTTNDDSSDESSDSSASTPQKMNPRTSKEDSSESDTNSVAQNTPQNKSKFDKNKNNTSASIRTSNDDSSDSEDSSESDTDSAVQNISQNKSKFSKSSNDISASSSDETSESNKGQKTTNNKITILQDIALNNKHSLSPSKSHNNANTKTSSEYDSDSDFVDSPRKTKKSTNPSDDILDTYATRSSFEDFNQIDEWDGISENEEVYIVRIPKKLNVEDLIGENLNLNKATKVKSNNLRFKSSVNKDVTKDVCVLGTSKNIKNISVLKSTGDITFSELHKEGEEVKCSLESYTDVPVPFPTILKQRHPLFGSDFVESISLHEQINEKLKHAAENAQKSTKKKSKKKHKETHEVCNNNEDIFNLLKTHESKRKIKIEETSNILDEIISNADSATKKTKKHKDSVSAGDALLNIFKNEDSSSLLNDAGKKSKKSSPVTAGDALLNIKKEESSFDENMSNIEFTNKKQKRRKDSVSTSDALLNIKKEEPSSILDENIQNTVIKKIKKSKHSESAGETSLNISNECNNILHENISTTEISSKKIKKRRHSEHSESAGETSLNISNESNNILHQNIPTTEISSKKIKKRKHSESTADSLLNIVKQEHKDVKEEDLKPKEKHKKKCKKEISDEEVPEKIKTEHTDEDNKSKAMELLAQLNPEDLMKLLQNAALQGTTNNADQTEPKKSKKKKKHKGSD